MSVMKMVDKRKSIDPISKCWAALIEVEARRPVDGFVKGNRAFVNVVVLAASRAAAKEALINATGKLGFGIVRVERIYRIATRIDQGKVSKRLWSLCKKAMKTECAQFGVFHAWAGDRSPDQQRAGSR